MASGDNISALSGNYKLSWTMTLASPAADSSRACLYLSLLSAAKKKHDNNTSTTTNNNYTTNNEPNNDDNNNNYTTTPTTTTTNNDNNNNNNNKLVAQQIPTNDMFYERTDMWNWMGSHVFVLVLIPSQYLRHVFSQAMYILYVYIYIYTCIYVCMCIYIYIYIYICLLASYLGQVE